MLPPRIAATTMTTITGITATTITMVIGTISEKACRGRATSDTRTECRLRGRTHGTASHLILILAGAIARAAAIAMSSETGTNTLSTIRVPTMKATSADIRTTTDGATTGKRWRGAKKDR